MRRGVGCDRLRGGRSGIDRENLTARGISVWGVEMFDEERGFGVVGEGGRL